MTQLAAPPTHPQASERLKSFMTGLVKRNPGEPEFRQAVQEVAETLIPYILEHPQYDDASILERLTVEFVAVPFECGR